MKKIKLNEIYSFFKEKVFNQIDSKILVYLVFVGISAVFWLFNKLGDDFTTTINYPVSYKNLPKKKVLISELPSNLKLDVKANGYNLLVYKLKVLPDPLVIDLHDYSNKFNDPKILKFKLHTRYAREEINKQMPADFEVLNILPDTISFLFANVVKRRVPIKPNVKLEFEQQCMLNDKIKFIPDSITVEGPHVIIDTLAGVYNSFMSFSALSKPVKRNVSLVEIKKLRFDKKRVVMQLPVSKFTEVSFNVPVTAINVPDTIDLKIFPQTIKVSGLVSLQDYDKISANDFSLEANYTNIEKLLGQKLDVKLVLSHPKVKSVHYNPQSVEFIIEKSIQK